MPVSRCGEAYKFSKPFKCPFCITSLYNNGAELKSIDKLRSKSIQVALNRIRRCPEEMQNAEDTRSNSQSEDADNVEEEGDESRVSLCSGQVEVTACCSQRGRWF